MNRKTDFLLICYAVINYVSMEQELQHQKDIAAEKGVSQQAIASRMKTILKNLKKFLK